jgi:hypothetical protein
MIRSILQSGTLCTCSYPFMAGNYCKIDAIMVSQAGRPRD